MSATTTRAMPTPPEQRRRRSTSPVPSDASAASSASPYLHPPSTPTTSPAQPSAALGTEREDGGALGAFLAEVDEWLLHIGARVAELERRHWMHRSREDALLAGAAMVVSPRRMQAPGRVL